MRSSTSTMPTGTRPGGARRRGTRRRRGGGRRSARGGQTGGPCRRGLHDRDRFLNSYGNLGNLYSLPAVHRQAQVGTLLALPEPTDTLTLQDPTPDR
jgi:hypothetical protein